MRILLLGSSGQIGWELQRTLTPLGELVSHDRSTIDLSNLEQVRGAIRSITPDLIVNAAAYTAVDQAESEPDIAYRVNAEAPGLIAEEANTLGAGLIYFSTDYVFDGLKQDPYLESDPPNPVNVYGASKLAGEQRIAESGIPHWILRTSWVYSLRRDCFPIKVLKWVRHKPEVAIATDQIGSPSWCRLLSETTGLMISAGLDDLTEWMKDRQGIYHLAGSGSTSRFEFARAIVNLDPASHEHVASEIRPALSSEFPARANRPKNSALGCSKLEAAFEFELPGWRQSLRLAMEEFHPGVLNRI